MRSPHVLASVALALIAGPLMAQTPAPTGKPAAATQAPVAAPRAMTLHDLASWKRLGRVALSPDGQWAAWRVNPAEGDGEVILRATKGDKVFSFQTGSGAGDLSFSKDSKWLTFAAFPSKKEADGLKKMKKPALPKAMIVDLATGKATTHDKVRRAVFAGERSGWIALTKASDAPAAPPAPGTRPKGSDVVLRELATGLELNLGNVAESRFDKSGRYFAWTVEAEGRAGNGVNLRDMETGAVRVLDSGDATFEQLRWTEKGDGLTVLRGTEDKAFKDRLYAAVGFTGLGGEIKKTIFDPKDEKAFPAGMSLSPDRAAEWSTDLSRLVFGLRAVEKKTDAKPEGKDEEKKEGEAKPEAKVDTKPEAKLDAKAESKAAPAPLPDLEPDERADLVLWHHKETRLPIQQQVEKERDKRQHQLAVFHVADKKFVRLADETLKQVSLSPEGTWALGLDDDPYEHQSNLDGKRFVDVYGVNPRTGERRKVLARAQRMFGVTQDGRTLLHHQDGHFHALDLTTGKDVNLTRSLKATFWDQDDDHNVVKPPTRPFGFSTDQKHVLLSDGWDVWKVALDGSGGENLTRTGRQEAIRFERRIVTDPDEKAIDLAQPLVFTTYGEWTKKAGLTVIAPGKAPRRAFFEDALFNQVQKAEKADTWLFSRETAANPPEVMTTGADLQKPVKLSDHAAQLKPFLACTGSRLVDYKGVGGKRLQGALFLPANPKPGTPVPTVVYIYEKLSERLHGFQTPGISGGGFNPAWYLSQGYAVFNPDITYRLNDPGMSAVACILPALKAAIATGVVDEKRVALHGHSWGGYQTAFTVTQTNAFKAAIAGAALTDLVSMSTLVYKNTGSSNQPIFESSQGRFTGPVTERWEDHVRNSPVFHARKVQTPLMILQNDKDGAVDWTQGVEYFNTLKRLGKDVVMLEYTGENHGLEKMANRKDYMVRMKAFFDHHLMGKPAPQWLKEGLPLLKLEDHLKETVKAMKDEAPKPAPKAKVQAAAKPEVAKAEEGKAAPAAADTK